MHDINRVVNQAIANGNLTLEEIAAQVKCTQSYISQIRSGKKIPSNPIVRRLAELFHQEAGGWVELAERARYNRKYADEDQKGVKSGDVDSAADAFVQLERLLLQLKTVSDRKIVLLSAPTKIKLSQELVDLQRRLLALILQLRNP